MDYYFNAVLVSMYPTVERWFTLIEHSYTLIEQLSILQPANVTISQLTNLSYLVNHFGFLKCSKASLQEKVIKILSKCYYREPLLYFTIQMIRNNKSKDFNRSQLPQFEIWIRKRNVHWWFVSNVWSIVHNICCYTQLFSQITD